MILIEPDTLHIIKVGEAGRHVCDEHNWTTNGQLYDVPYFDFTMLGHSGLQSKRCAELFTYRHRSLPRQSPVIQLRCGQELDTERPGRQCWHVIIKFRSHQDLIWIKPVNVQDFLSLPEIQLPLIRDDDDDFEDFVRRRLSEYVKLLPQIDDPRLEKSAIDTHRDQAERICRIAPEIVHAIYSGDPLQAYMKFDDAILGLGDQLSSLAIDTFQKGVGYLFRVRRELRGVTTREEIFHVPFEKRHQVASYRYSLPGVPCLYLSGSLYACWAEMGRPPFHELYASIFWPSGANLRILNFSLAPKRQQMYLQDGTGHQELILTNLSVWPLMALCSIVVKHRDAPFKPEYIFPQLFLQWVMKTGKFDGVCYFSLHVRDVTAPLTMPFCNLVLPAQSVKPKGRCDTLRSKLRLTEPQNWELLRATARGCASPYTPNFNFEFVDGLKESYQASEFGLVESRLRFLAEKQKEKGKDFEVLP